MPINPEVIDESHLIPPTFSDDVVSNEPTRTCEACGQFVGQNPLVKRGLIPPSLADVLVPPPVKPVTEKRRLSKCVTSGKVISGDEMLQVLKEREAAEVRKQEKKRREEEKELRQKKTMIEDEMKATKRQKKQDERIQREKEKENEKERLEKYGKLAEKKYTCGVCGVRGRVNDEVCGIEWYGCDNDMCTSTGWFHFDCLSECERDAKPEEAKQEEVKVYGDLDTSTEPEIPDEVCPSIPVSLLSTEGGGKDNGVVDDGNDKEGKDNDVTDKEVQDDCDDDAGSGLYQMPFTATPVDDNRPPDYCNVGDFNFKRGSDCIRHTANAAGLQFPERITTTKLRKYLATVSQIFNLSTTEMTELARHMGHELSVHKKFYRLQDDVIELAKVSRLLIAVEEGKAAKFAGCSLDDINVSDIPEEEAVDEPDDDDEKDDEDMLFSYDVDETCCDTRSAAFNNMRHHEDMEVCDNTLHGGDNQFQDEDMDNNRHTNKEKSTGNISDGSTYDISSMEENRPVKEPKKDKCQRKIWTVEEKNALTELVTKSYDDRKPPRKSEILKCQIHYPVLKGINWLNIKYQVWALSQKKCAAKKKVIQELGLN